MVKRKMETKTDQQGKQQFDMSTVLVTKKPSGIVRPSFISHPNRIILHVLKKSYNPVLLKTKEKLGPSFIYHPNGIVVSSQSTMILTTIAIWC